MADIFPTAAQARAGARNNLAILDEVRDLEAAVLTAIALGNLNVDVTDSQFTDPLSNDPVTGRAPNATAYYTAYFSDNGDRSLKEQIDFVQKYFVDLGYQCQPLKNTSTGNTMMWRILW